MTGFVLLPPKKIGTISSTDGATTWTKIETPTTIIEGVGRIDYKVSFVPAAILSENPSNIIKTDAEGKLFARMEWTGTPSW